MRQIISFINTILITWLSLFMLSCDRMPTEDDAIKENQAGVSFMNAGQYELALSSFTKAIKNPKLSKQTKGTICRNIAITYNQLEKTDSSIHYSTLAAKCFKKNSYDYLVNMADVDLVKGKTALGLSRLLKAANMNPDEMTVNNTLGLIYLGEYEAEFTDLDKALTYNSRAFEISGDRVTEEVLARTYYKMEDYKNAEMHFERLLENYPDMVSYSLNTGMIKFKLKKKPEAEKLFEKVISMDSSYINTIQEFREAN